VCRGRERKVCVCVCLLRERERERGFIHSFIFHTLGDSRHDDG
jgi:hypothetical protein